MALDSIYGGPNLTLADGATTIYSVAGGGAIQYQSSAGAVIDQSYQNATTTAFIRKGWNAPSWVAGQSYVQGQVVNYNGAELRSLVNGNTATPVVGPNWATASNLPSDLTTWFLEGDGTSSRMALMGGGASVYGVGSNYPAGGLVLPAGGVLQASDTVTLDATGSYTTSSISNVSANSVILACYKSTAGSPSVTLKAVGVADVLPPGSPPTGKITITGDASAVVHWFVAKF